MALAQQIRKWTVEEFFAWHEHQEKRYELVAGLPVLKHPPVPVVLEGDSEPTMMTGANRRHSKINGNLLRRISDQLEGSGCEALSNDAAVRTAGDQIRFPDLVVDCGTQLDDGFVFENPRLLVEIISPSTRSFDLAGKVTEYWQIETVVYVLIVDPEQRRAQLHVRQAGEMPRLHLFQNPDEIIGMPEIGVTLRLGEIFAGLPPAVVV